MPSSSIILLFSFAFGGSNALPWIEAQQTRVYQADQWSPRPTTLPADPAKLFKRDSVDVEICGWIGGNSASAATCQSGSSCVHDTINSVVGCCATSGPCTAGIYTSCIDMSSAGWTQPSGVQSNGVFECSGTDVCFKNTFPGGYSQYGCGQPSLATSVETTFSGQASDVTLQQVFTSIQLTSAISSSISRASSSTSTPTQTATTNPTSAASHKKHTTGIIEASVFGGLFGLASIGATLYFCLQKWQARKQRRAERRAGPFKSVHDNDQGPLAPYQPYRIDNLEPTAQTSAGSALPSTYSDRTPPMTHHQFSTSSNSQPQNREAEPLVSEIEDFANGYHNAIGAAVTMDDESEKSIYPYPDESEDAATGLGVRGILKNSLNSHSSITSGHGRTQDPELTHEALRAPSIAAVDHDFPHPLRSSPSSESLPLHLRTSRSPSSLLNPDPHSAIPSVPPPRNPIRNSLAGIGSAVSATVGRDNAPRYQLVDEVREDAPVLQGPGQLQMRKERARASRGTMKSVKWEDTVQ